MMAGLKPVPPVPGNHRPGSKTSCPYCQQEGKKNEYEGVRAVAGHCPGAGGGIGGAFVGGIALGKSQEVAEAAQVAPSAALTPGSAQQSFGALTAEQRDQFRQQFQGRELIAAGDPSSFGGGFSGRGGLTGAIEKIDGDTLTVNTPQGPLLATITAETTPPSRRSPRLRWRASWRACR